MTQTKGIAVIDNSMEPGTGDKERIYIKETVMHFQASGEQPGTPLKGFNEIATVSAGHPLHEYAPGSAIDKVFDYFDMRG